MSSSLLRFVQLLRGEVSYGTFDEYFRPATIEIRSLTVGRWFNYRIRSKKNDA